MFFPNFARNKQKHLSIYLNLFAYEKQDYPLPCFMFLH